MIIDSAEVGRVQCNCYVVGCEKTKEGVIIDAGGDVDLIEEMVRRHGLTIKYIICTHAHFDHIEGLTGLLKSIKAPILLHEGDLRLYEDIKSQGKIFGMELERTPPWDHMVKDGDNLFFGELSMKVLHTPGHSPGSITLATGGVAFTGDTIFAGSIGRTDLPGGSFETLISSAKEKILSLPDQTKLYPGHGPATSVGHEKKFNPFLGEDAMKFI
jgi:hydroxyacylglutathione hydrolase